MSAGLFTVLNVALKKIADGTFDLDSHILKVCVCTNAQSITTAFTGSSGDARYADLTAEAAAGGGYSTTGASLSGVSWSQASGIATLDADDVIWEGCTLTAKYAVIYDDTATNKDILGFFDMNVGVSEGVVVSAGDLTIVWNSGGIFTLQRAA